MLPRGACFSLVQESINNAFIPVFRDGKRTYIEEGTRPRKDRNLGYEAVKEGRSALVLCFEKGIGYSLQRAESGFRSFSVYKE